MKIDGKPPYHPRRPNRFTTALLQEVGYQGKGDGEDSNENTWCCNFASKHSRTGANWYGGKMVRTETLKKERTRRPHPLLWDSQYATVEVTTSSRRTYGWEISFALEFFLKFSLQRSVCVKSVKRGTMWRKSGTDRTGKKRDRPGHRTSSGGLERANSTELIERIYHDEEFGEENVEQVDEEWANFERVLSKRLRLTFTLTVCFGTDVEREFRERHLLNAAKDNMPRQKKSSRKRRAQAFYPMPMPSMSDTVDQDSNSVSSSDEASDMDEDGYIRTLVSTVFP
uniref:Uncharacterized protein n=1 Tax=Anopheles culicifacies TaxID=139723 RepID=A0A182LVM3_9DIPT